ncbi:MAG: hypothetical protein C4524_00770 [Candidatus Zixiibacteriota bacterium]|nr:MAG: hypothetical protein C4524_00770 [candidate division Zixibacteria bacterium]
MDTSATLTCPHCGHAAILDMPLDYCLHAHVCASCAARLTPQPRDCCVFCSYADKPCPPRQKQLAGEPCG